MKQVTKLDNYKPFYEWMKVNQTQDPEDGTPMGDFIADALLDKNVPADSSDFAEWYMYLACRACPEAIEAFVETFCLWLDLNTIRKEIKPEAKC